MKAMGSNGARFCTRIKVCAQVLLACACLQQVQVVITGSKRPTSKYSAGPSGRIRSGWESRCTSSSTSASLLSRHQCAHLPSRSSQAHPRGVVSVAGDCPPVKAVAHVQADLRVGQVLADHVQQVGACRQVVKHNATIAARPGGAQLAATARQDEFYSGGVHSLCKANSYVASMCHYLLEG